MIDRVSGRYGRRGAWLILLGGVWLVIGLSLIVSPDIPPRSWVAIDYAPPPLRAALWGGTGLVAIWTGLRGPECADYLGHVALWLMPAVLSISFTLSWLIWGVTSTLSSLGFFHVIGWAGGGYAALVWFLMTLMLRLVADWPNPSQPIPRPPTDACERI